MPCYGKSEEVLERGSVSFGSAGLVALFGSITSASSTAVLVGASTGYVSFVSAGSQTLFGSITPVSSTTVLVGASTGSVSPVPGGLVASFGSVDGATALKSWSPTMIQYYTTIHQTGGNLPCSRVAIQAR